MNYNALINKLFKTNLQGGIKLGLQNVVKMQQLLGFPDHQFSSIHIAGTNGKGSTSIKIATALQTAGFRVGLYTSPHLSCFRERIRINGKMISENRVEVLLNSLFLLTEREEIPATFFELTTMLAFLHFAEEKVDFAVLETGLGGRLDATNCVSPILSVITSIDLDHTEILGCSREEIAKEKAGIIKENIPVIIGPHVPFETIKKIADQQSSPLYQVSNSPSSFDEENRFIAHAALNELRKTISLEPFAIEQGINAQQPCRFETHHFGIPIILDVAHNPNGLQRLFALIEERYPKKKRRIVFGLSANKDILESLRILQANGDHFHIVEASNGRGKAARELAKQLQELGIGENQINLISSIERNFLKAIEVATQYDEIVVVCGTFFIMREIRAALQLQDPIDPIDLNERPLSQK